MSEETVTQEAVVDPFADPVNDHGIDNAVDEQKKVPLVSEGVAKDKKKVTWQFKYRRYQYILPHADKKAALTPTGVRPNLVLKARNWRLDLDMTNPDDKLQHEFLCSSKRNGVDFWLLKDVGKTDKITERAETLRKLNDMSVGQLSSMLTPGEKESLGILPNCIDKMTLIMGVIDTKKLVQ